MSYLIFFVVSFIAIFIIYRLFVLRKNKAVKRMNNSKDVELVLKLAKLKKEDVDMNKLIRILSISNSLIISISGTIVLIISDRISNFYIWLIATMGLGMVVLLPLIIVIYKFVGSRLKKEGK